MHFHLFGPPPPHLIAILVASALAFVAGALLVSRTRFASTIAGACGRSGRQAVFERGLVSNNSAFEAYRHEVLAKMELEAKEFHQYLTGLRRAKDKAEFDRFMFERMDEPVAGSGTTPREAGPV